MIHTLNVMKISFFPTGIRTVCPSSTPAIKEKGNVTLHYNPHVTWIPTTLAIPKSWSPQQHLHIQERKAQDLPVGSTVTPSTGAQELWPKGGGVGTRLYLWSDHYAPRRLVTSIPTEFFWEMHHTRNTGQPPKAAGELQVAHPGQSQRSKSSAPPCILSSLVRKVISTLFWAKLRLSRFPPSPQASSRTNERPKTTKLFEFHSSKPAFKTMDPCKNQNLSSGRAKQTFISMARKFISLLALSIANLSTRFVLKITSLLQNFSRCSHIRTWQGPVMLWRQVPCCWPSGSK